MTSDTEIKWRIKILRSDNKTDDMWRFCHPNEDRSEKNCFDDSATCKYTNHPTTKECKKCLCSVCRNAHPICRDVDYLLPLARRKHKV